MNENKISVSPGNKKMGAIPSVSLPPVITCPHGCPCAKKCYAAKLCRIRPTVKKAYERNLDILTRDKNSYWAQVKAAACTTKYFRFHVSGDIPSFEYLCYMIDTVKALPDTQFLCFTKKYNLVNLWIREFENLPSNLHLIFSEWSDSWTVPNPYNLPTAAVIFKGQTPADNWKVCGGNCTECACRGCGCWELKPGETIAFYEH